jgi:hypothetical protein
MKKLFERSLFLLVVAVVFVASGLRLDYAPTAAYDVSGGVGADGKPQISSTAMLVDLYGTQNYIAPNGEAVSLPLYKLVGDSFTGDTLDTNMWTPTLSASAVAAISNGQLSISTGALASGSAVVQSTHIGRFSGLAPNKAKLTLQVPDGGTINNVRRWGAFSITDGAFFELNEYTLCIVTRRASVDTRVCSGAFNGVFGSSFRQNGTLHAYEIIMQPRQIVFVADNKVIHRPTAANDPWTNTLHLPIRFENVNAAGSTTNVSMLVRLGTIARFGIPQTQVDGYYQAGLTTGVILKYGPGNLHNLALSGVTNGAV